MANALKIDNNDIKQTKLLALHFSISESPFDLSFSEILKACTALRTTRITLDGLLKTFLENWDGKVLLELGTFYSNSLFRDYDLSYISFRNKTFLFFKIVS